MFGTRIKRWLAILALPMALTIAGSGSVRAEGSEDELCKNPVFSPVPFSVCGGPVPVSLPSS